jgi:hypothetical protein
MNYRYIFSIVLFAFFYLGCDFDKLTGYNHDAEKIPDSAKMYGIIYSKHDSLPIQNALILVGHQATYTDENGQYIFYYYLGADEERNKPINVRITAAQHLPLDTSIVIFPENNLTKILAYAAPIINRIALVNTICQAEIFDYQGADDIVQVTGTFYYIRPGERAPSLTTKQPLTRVGDDENNTAFFQAVLAESIPGFGNLMTSSFSIYARDRLAFADSSSNLVTGVDTLLFPPEF